MTTTITLSRSRNLSQTPAATNRCFTKTQCLGSSLSSWVYAIELALEAILGQRSAHSLATGPEKITAVTRGWSKIGLQMIYGRSISKGLGYILDYTWRTRVENELFSLQLTQDSRWLEGRHDTGIGNWWNCMSCDHPFRWIPVMAEPFISPLLLTITPALSSK